MKLLFIFLFIPITFSTFAQVKSISPLSCSTWGPDQFLDFETVQRAAPPRPYERYPAVYTPGASTYESFGKNRGVYAWHPDNVPYHYINNVQVLRWNICDNQTYRIFITDMFDSILYSAPTTNSCGLIIFPDSLTAFHKRFFIRILPSDKKTLGGDLRVINFSSIELIPREEEERLAVLNQLKSCNNLECKIKILKEQKATLDILSLLELEKLKDPTNKNIDKLYWEIVSQIRYEYSGISWER